MGYCSDCVFKGFKEKGGWGVVGIKFSGENAMFRGEETRVVH